MELELLVVSNVGDDRLFVGVVEYEGSLLDIELVHLVGIQKVRESYFHLLLGHCIDQQLIEFIDVGAEIIIVDLVHDLGVVLHNLEVDGLVVVPEEEHEHAVLDESVLLDEMNVGARFLQRLELGLDKVANPLARLELQFGQLRLYLPDTEVLEQVVLLDVLQLAAELLDILNVDVYVVIVDGSLDDIVNQLGLQHHILNEVREGLAQVLPVVERHVHVHGALLKEGHLVLDLRKSIPETLEYVLQFL